ncbi:TetR/AcrR family transcriptional regulator [Paenibacillus sp. GYB004]|uniref:TetR/AcrR family transcriptional regulator n=1 Tax=Paenibacillus sp. GYB004 TaxID=2994393 RepID=UPI002F96B177
MPKIVDHDKRRVLLAEAAWRVIRRVGIDGVSVRNVAEEAGMSLGSLRHYFTTQSELLAFSMRLVSDRVYERITTTSWSGDPRQDMENIIAELVPLDDERLAECEVWMAFAGKAVADPALKSLNREIYDSLRNLFRMFIATLAEKGMMKPGVNEELEAEKLFAIVDGLVVHGVICPDEVTRARITAVVSYYFDCLLQPGPS